VVEEEKPGTPVALELLTRLEKAFQIKLAVTVVPPGTLYDREDLLSVGVVGKPQYIYTAEDLARQKYLKSVRV
jgi:phenylacetate-CoA ligase